MLLMVSSVTFGFQVEVSADSRLQGVALKDPTNVYQNTSTNSDVLKDYPQGTILVYESYNDSWYSATVYANGGWQHGFINKSDVETAVTDQTELKGVALKDPTAVYSEATTDSRTLKSYMQGSILVYRTFSENWYEATVYSGGDWRTGYIHKTHVENGLPEHKQEGLYGLGLKRPTTFYSDATLESAKVKSYEVGSRLYVETFTSDWYQATVYVDGNRRTVYIPHSHIGSPATEDAGYEGVALRNPTPVYKEATSTGGVWKSYPAGSILVYESFSQNWYQATVYANGGWRTGFIHHSHVENAVSEQQELRGIGLQNPTAVYQAASTGSDVLKSYPAGSVLAYETYTSGWYEATVYLNGNPTTGYINTNHVEGLYDQQETLQGRVLEDPTNVYTRASRSSAVLDQLRLGSVVSFKTFTKNWYEITLTVNGKRRVGYLNVSDVTTEDVTKVKNYDYTLNKMVDAQMNANPQTDLTGGLGWQHASENQVQYYTHPGNFPKGTQGHYQFLDISHSAGLTAEDAVILNQKFLDNAGILSGRAEAFINGGKKYHVNELYLIAHALLETGYGDSQLATGVSKWVKRTPDGSIVRDKNGDPVIMDISPKKVYNMYGIGAFDKCPYDCGAQRAYDNGWFDPNTAITEGAAFASQNYINNGQNTLYEMRWNPGHLENYSYASHQYASDVGWAVKQTNMIYEMYQSVASDYSLIFEVPHFVNQADAPKGSTTWKGVPSSEEPEEEQTVTSLPTGVLGVTTANLNYRSTPSTADDSNIITLIPDGSQIEVVATNGTWYKVKFDGDIGWVHGDYVTILNLLKIAVDNLNIRSAPDSSQDNEVGQEDTGTLLVAVLDNNKKVTSDEWYKVYYNGKEAWISDGDGTFINEIE